MDLQQVKLLRLFRKELLGEAGGRITKSNSHHLQVKPEAAAGFVYAMLGDAFISNSLGSVGRASIEGRVLGIYFEANAPSASLLSGLRTLHANLKGGEGFQVIYVSCKQTQEEFNKAFREEPWLAIPFAHAQRRARLRSLFEAGVEGR